MCLTHRPAKHRGRRTFCRCLPALGVSRCSQLQATVCWLLTAHSGPGNHLQGIVLGCQEPPPLGAHLWASTKSVIDTLGAKFGPLSESGRNDCSMAKPRPGGPEATPRSAPPTAPPTPLLKGPPSKHPADFRSSPSASASAGPTAGPGLALAGRSAWLSGKGRGRPGLMRVASGRREERPAFSAGMVERAGDGLPGIRLRTELEPSLLVRSPWARTTAVPVPHL